MLSIITSIHNQIGMNKLFYETLVRETTLPFELIVIDNNSTDGSRDYFRDKAILIENDANYTYSYCQNKGIQKSKYDNLVFLNNDLLVSKGWDERILDILSQNPLLEVVSFATNDRIETPLATKKLSRRWKRIKYPILKVFGAHYFVLKLMRDLMYGNFEKYTEQRFKEFGNQLMEGFSGSAILFKRTAVEKIGFWDEKIYAADFDIYCRTKERNIEYADILPIQIALGIYFHHYQRLTLKSKPIPFKDFGNIISLEEKWNGKEQKYLESIDC